MYKNYIVSLEAWSIMLSLFLFTYDIYKYVQIEIIIFLCTQSKKLKLLDTKFITHIIV